LDEPSLVNSESGATGHVRGRSPFGHAGHEQTTKGGETITVDTTTKLSSGAVSSYNNDAAGQEQEMKRDKHGDTFTGSKSSSRSPNEKFGSPTLFVTGGDRSIALNGRYRATSLDIADAYSLLLATKVSFSVSSAQAGSSNRSYTSSTESGKVVRLMCKAVRL